MQCEFQLFIWQCSNVTRTETSIHSFIQVHYYSGSRHSTGIVQGFHAKALEVCGYSIFATRPVPVAQDRYPYPYPTRTQNHYPIRPVPAGIPVPVIVKPSNV